MGKVKAEIDISSIANQILDHSCIFTEEARKILTLLANHGNEHYQMTDDEVERYGDSDGVLFVLSVVDETI